MSALDDPALAEIYASRQQERRLLALYANHAPQCHCFICRHLTDEQPTALDAFWAGWGGRKSITRNPHSPQRRRG